MNWKHFRAFVWLRWRLRANRMQRGGTLNAVLWVIVTVLGVLAALVLFAGSMAIGYFGLAEVAPLTLLLVWDGFIFGFLWAWIIGLVIELQRAEVLSLDKFLHLPVSLASAFLINYLSGLLNVTMVLFVPAMVGLAFGLALSRGPALLWILPPLTAFLLMVTALTNQFQGWLATLMANKRRRRTIIVLVTITCVLIAQLPNVIVQVMAPRKDVGLLTNEQYQARIAEQARKQEPAQNKPATEIQDQAEKKAWQQLELPVLIANLVLPPGWLALGASSAAAGDFLPAVLGALGLGLIGTASLWRSYRTTLRLYTGQINARGKKRAAAPAVPARTDRVLLLERKLPWISEQAAAIALGGFRSLVRAPEAKMMLLSPLIFAVIFGSMLTRSSPPESGPVRLLMATGAMALVLLSMVQLIGNQFGFDRNGFRVFVLCGARRRDILLGKNLSFAPFALGLGFFVTVVLQFLYPMPIDYFASTLPQFVSMYLLCCILGNLLSILAAMPIAPGTLRPTNAKLVPVLLQFCFVFLFPLVLLPTLLPLGVESALAALGWLRGFPVCLLLAVMECAVVVLIYSLVLTWQGRLLQAREKRLLEIVSLKAE